MINIFVHIPKTGGTSVYNALQSTKLHRSHERAVVLRSSYIDWNSHFSFTIIRNPWDRAVSWYYWMDIGDREHLSFHDWICVGCPTHHSDFDPIDQLAYFVDAAGNDLVQYIGRFEDLNGTVQILSNRMNYSYGLLEHWQRSKRPHGPYQQFYNARTSELLANHTRSFIERFGYTYE